MMPSILSTAIATYSAKPNASWCARAVEGLVSDLFARHQEQGPPRAA